MCRKANYEDGISMNKVQETLVEWKAHAKVKRTRPETSTQPMGFTTLLLSTKQDIADAGLNIKGLIFFPSQSENTMRDLS